MFFLHTIEKRITMTMVTWWWRLIIFIEKWSCFYKYIYSFSWVILIIYNVMEDTWHTLLNVWTIITLSRNGSVRKEFCWSDNVNGIIDSIEQDSILDVKVCISILLNKISISTYEDLYIWSFVEMFNWITTWPLSTTCQKLQNYIQNLLKEPPRK